MSRVIARLQMRTRPLLFTFTLLCRLYRRGGDDILMPVRKTNLENELANAADPHRKSTIIFYCWCIY